MKSEPSALRDFTVDGRVWLLSAVSIGIGACATALAVLLLRLIAIATNLFYYHRLSAVTCVSGRQPAGPLDGGGPGNRRCPGGADGAFRVRQDPRTRDSRGHRGNPAASREG